MILTKIFCQQRFRQPRASEKNIQWERAWSIVSVFQQRGRLSICNHRESLA